jgi:peptidoglycan/xylan/chitin deacetylase (PgdA/CDA1 family)
MGLTKRGLIQTVRTAAKATAATAMHYTGLRRAMARVRRAQAGGRRILMVSYHRVVEDFTGEVARSIPGLLISKETFRRQLQDARAAGYELVSLSFALDVLAGRQVARRDLCVVTFDDGYADVYRNALPILKEMGVPAILYLPASMIGTDRRFNHDRLFHLVGILRARKVKPLYDSLPPTAAALLEPVLGSQRTLSSALDDFIGEHPTRSLTELIDALERQLGGGPELRPEQGDPMSWDEARSWVNQGFDVGAHTLDHTVLTLEDLTGIRRELVDSKQILEAELRRPIRDFAYCNGWYSDLIIQELVKAGYRSAVTTEDFPNILGGDPFTLKRKVLWENFSAGVVGYSAPLTSCHLDDAFGLLGVSHPVPGRRLQAERRVD